jgi:hypothetical protein
VTDVVEVPLGVDVTVDVVLGVKLDVHEEVSDGVGEAVGVLTTTTTSSSLRGRLYNLRSEIIPSYPLVPSDDEPTTISSTPPRLPDAVADATGTPLTYNVPTRSGENVNVIDAQSSETTAPSGLSSTKLTTPSSICVTITRPDAVIAKLSAVSPAISNSRRRLTDCLIDASAQSVFSGVFTHNPNVIASARTGVSTFKTSVAESLPELRN